MQKGSLTWIFSHLITRAIQYSLGRVGDLIIKMPYNTTPIRPRKEVTGQVQLPCKISRVQDFLVRTPSEYSCTDNVYIVSRVKKIIAVDPDINICSNNAAFAITLATVRLPI